MVDHHPERLHIFTDVGYSILFGIAVRPNLSSSVAMAILDDPHVENREACPAAADMQPRVFEDHEPALFHGFRHNFLPHSLKFDLREAAVEQNFGSEARDRMNSRHVT